MPDPPGRVQSGGRALGPEDVSSRQFPSTRRGLDPEAVRRFLVEVADQLREARRIESELRTALEAAEQSPQQVPEDPTLATAVGEETRRVLQAAHVAARDIVSASERRAAEVVGGAENIVAERARTAEAAAEELMERTRAEAAALLEATRDQCRRMVEEARDARRRILEDLVEKRHGLHLQLEQLRAGKDALSEIVESVSTSVLASVAAVRARLEGAEGQARAAAADAFAEPVADDIEIEALIPEPLLELPTVGPAPEELASDEAGAASGDVGATDRVLVTDVREPGESVLPGPAATPAEKAMPTGETSGRAGGTEAGEFADTPPALDALFARIRAEHASDDEPPVVVPGLGAAASVDVEPAPVPSGSGHVTDARATVGSGSPASDIPDGPADSGTVLVRENDDRPVEDDRPADDDTTVIEDQADDSSAMLLAHRDALLAAAAGDLARALKRQLRLEENELLDAFRNLRRAGGDTAALVPSRAMALRLVEAAAAALEAAALAGETFAVELLKAGTARSTTHLNGSGIREIAERLGEQIVEPIGRRVSDGLAERFGDDAEDGGAGTVVGPAFRDWKGARVDGVAEDFAADAFAVGTLRVSRARGAAVRWIVKDADGNCPDCDDNGIAGVLAAGESFPTGHHHPPVHPGCRCLLVPVPG